MSAGDFLLALGAGAGLVAAVAAFAAFASTAREDARLARLARAAFAAHVAGVGGAAALMLLKFVAIDLRTAYVWDHTHASYPLAYRVAGLWGGQDGTVLLWGAFVSVFAAVVALRGAGSPLRARAAALLALLGGALGSFALAGGAFKPTDAADLALAPRGAGLADVLVTPLMVIHPPIQFAAYALIAVPAAFAAAAWVGPRSEARAWLAPAYAWARVAWLLSTIGLGLGALWAYYVLSFGGYWAWDPVETSNLLPWLALTAFLHAGKHALRFGDHPLSAPLLAVTAYALTLFATFATRSGLWVSVHAFTDPTSRFEPDAAARLLNILASHEPTRAFLALGTVSLLGLVALFLLHEARALPRAAAVYARAHAAALLALGGVAAADPHAAYAGVFEAARLLGVGMAPGLALVGLALVGVPPTLVYLLREAEPLPRRLDARMLMAGAVAVLAVSAAVAFVLNLQVVNGQDRALFDARAPLLALPLVAVLTIQMALAPLGRRRALLLALFGLAGGAAGFALFPDARVLALAAPPLAAALVATLAKLVHVQGRGAPLALRAAGILLLTSALLGLVMWSNPPSRIGALDVPRALAVPIGFAGVALGSLGVLGAVACFRARAARLALAGAAAATLTAGYGIGALLGAAALVLVARERSAFAPGDGFWRIEAPRLRETGIYVVHFALVLGLLGYAASTYSQASETTVALEPGAAVDVGAYTVVVAGAEPSVGADGRVDRLTHPVALLKDGAPAGESDLVLSWRGEPSGHYATRLDVRRSLLDDVYVQPMAFHTAADGWVGDGATARLASGDVDAVTFRVSVLPLMTLVWAGLWMMGLGMGLILVAARLAPDLAPRGVPVREAANAAAAERAPPGREA